MLRVIAALAFATAVPAWAQEEPSSEYVDPTIVKDETRRASDLALSRR